MLEYLYQEGVEPCSREPLKVLCDGHICGEIRKVEGGYQYFPKGYKTGGYIFDTVTDVQLSLSYLTEEII